MQVTNTNWSSALIGMCEQNYVFESFKVIELGHSASIIWEKESKIKNLKAKSWVPIVFIIFFNNRQFSGHPSIPKTNIILRSWLEGNYQSALLGPRNDTRLDTSSREVSPLARVTQINWWWLQRNNQKFKKQQTPWIYIFKFTSNKAIING